MKHIKILAPNILTCTLDHGSNNRSSRPELFCKKGVLKDFAKITGKYLCQSL